MNLLFYRSVSLSLKNQRLEAVNLTSKAEERKRESRGTLKDKSGIVKKMKSGNIFTLRD
jgi:hypothetical protein